MKFRLRVGPNIDRTANGRIALAWPALFAVVIAWIPAAAPAADLYWDGSTNTGWNTAANWSTSSTSGDPMFDPVAPPGAVDIASFNIDPLSAAQTVNLNAPQSASGLVFRPTAGPITIESGAGGPHPLSLGTNGIAVTSGAGAVTINAPIDFLTSQAWLNDGSALTFNGNISSGPNSLIVGGAGNTVATGTIGTCCFENTLTKTGSGELTLTNSNFFRRTVIEAGTLHALNANALGSTAGMTLAGGTLRFEFFSGDIIVPVTLNPQGGTIDTRRIDLPPWSGNFTGPGSLTKIGNGDLGLKGTNSFTGGTTINGGSLTVGPAALPMTGNILVNGLGSLKLAPNQTGTFTYGSPGQLLTIDNGILQFLPGPGASQVIWDGNVILADNSSTFGTGRISGPISGPGNLAINAGTLELTDNNTHTEGTTVNNSATVLIADDARLGPGALSLAGGTLKTSAGVALNRVVVLTPQISPGGTIDTNGFDSTFGGIFFGPGSLTKTGAGTFTLGVGSNVHSGGTVINGGTLRVSSNSALGSAPVGITFGGGTLQTAASITTGRAVTVNPAGGTIDTDGFNSIFAGNFTQFGTLTKVGAGTLSLTGTNNFVFATTRVSEGTLALANTNNSGQYIVGSPTSARLEVQFGSTATIGQTIVGDQLGSIGEIEVAGAGSTLNANSGLTVGNSGIGSLLVSGGATVNGGIPLVASLPGSFGTATITGAGSTWNNFRLFVGGNPFTSGGTGSVTVDSGATLIALDELRIWPGGTLSGNGTVVTDVLDIRLGGALRGAVTVAGDVTNAGRVAPGFSPEIINIDGNYTQTADGTLEIEVGGLLPGLEHDKLVVSGSATLAGLLEVPLINGFVPTVNDQITFLTTGTGVTDFFDTVAAPNLKDVTPLAIKVLKTPAPPGAPQDIQLRFVERTAVNFTDPNDADWHQQMSWSTFQVPDTDNIVTVQNNRSFGDQRLDVQNANAFADEIVVEDPIAKISIVVHDSRSLSATARGVTIGNNGVVQLGTEGSGGLGGTLAGTTISIGAGGMLAGNGTVVGNLAFGTVPGPLPGLLEATLSPGLSVGHLDVEGDFQQGTGGTLMMEVQGAGGAGEFDTIAVSGQAQLGGTLVIDASALTNEIPGASFDILSANNGITPGTVFEQVETAGIDDLFFAPTYLPDIVRMTSYPLGDMNRDGALNSGDIDDFALALMNPDAYFDLRYLYGSQSGNMDGFGGLDFDDIDDFALRIGSSSGEIFAAIERLSRQVPEPGSVALAALGLFCCVAGLGTRRTARLAAIHEKSFATV